MSDADPSILNLSPDEKRAFAFLFNQADKDQLGVVTGENAVSFFERTKVSPNVLGEIWQIADTENRGLLTKPGFCMVLRLIGHYQAGREPSQELGFQPGPIPKFEGMQIPGIGAGAAPQPTSPSTGAFPPNALQPQLSGQGPIRVPPLDTGKIQQYCGLFERSGAQNGLLDGATAKAIFEKAGLPNETLGRIWMLSDREQRGALDQTEFIIAMHLLTSTKSRNMAALPIVLPPALYEAAARRGAPPPARQGSLSQAIPRQLSGQQTGPMRTQSPLARAQTFGAPPTVSAQTTGTPWLITPADKAKFDQFFNTIDTQGRGVLTGEQAVTFFSDSRLPEDVLAQIWDLADVNSEGQLNKDEFAVAMYLIRQQRAPNAPPLPAFLPPPLMPPSMRKLEQQTQSTAPAFNAAQPPAMPKSAADDLFGLDQPSPPRPGPQMSALQPQGTGASATRDPFSGGSPAPGSPSSPTQFRSAQQPQAAGSMFKPFVPTSAFGSSLQSQNTGGSFGSSQGASRAPPQPSTNDDLLGDSETQAVESSKMTNETTELANMSTQIGNLRSQMEQTQGKKNIQQAEVNQTNTQKRDLEQRLHQFRAQYEQEVRAVKELEQQLTTSRDSTKKLSQELAMLEGGYQDLQTQHQTVSQQLQADQQENASLKQRMSQINAEVARLKPEIEKLKLDARQQKGLVSINKKQLATNEGERARLQSEKGDLEREAEETAKQVSAQPTGEVVAPTSALASPASTLSATNPFFRKQSGDNANVAARSISPQQTGSAPTPSAFDTLFGPPGAFAPSGQAHSRTGTPPATSFIGRNVSGPSAPAAMTDSVQSVSSAGQDTPSATPPPSEQAKDSPVAAEPPPPPESRQFTSSQLPVGNPDLGGIETDASSTQVLPPASRAGEPVVPGDVTTPGSSSPLHVPGSFTEDPKPETAAKEAVPGAFPNDVSDTTPVPSTNETPAAGKDDFDSAFANFGDSDKARDAETEDPFAASSSKPAPPGFSSEFPPIRTLEHDDEDDSDSDDENTSRAFDNHFTAASPPRNQETEFRPESPTYVAAPIAVSSLAAAASQVTSSSTPLPSADAQRSPPTYEESDKVSHGGGGERTEENNFPQEFGGLLPAREDPTISSPPPDETAAALAKTTTKELTPEPIKATAVQTPPATSNGLNPFSTTGASSSVPAAASTAPAAKSAFDDFDAFDDLSEAKEADKTDFDFGFPESGNEFNPTFDSPAASMTTGVASSQQTPAPVHRSLHQSEDSSSSNVFNTFQPTTSVSGLGTANSSIQQTPQNISHDWDAIFSGLDNFKAVDTSVNSGDPWGAPTNGTAAAHDSSGITNAQPTPPASDNLRLAMPPPGILKAVPPRGGAITPGTEHDDPILKRLTSMGYPRVQALEALERFDYDINKAVDHLSSQ